MVQSALPTNNDSNVDALDPAVSALPVADETSPRVEDGSRKESVAQDQTEKPATAVLEVIKYEFDSSSRSSEDQATPDKEQETADEKIQRDEGPDDTELQTSFSYEEKPYSVFTHNEKRFIILCAGVCSFLSPVSAQIYLPALNPISADLHVSHSLVNLTITTYMILQGLAPTFIGGFSDNAGRRPAYLVCFVIYMAANLGLALQNSYAALMVLRCIQSAGSSGTVALANAVAADVITAQERGVYVSYLSLAPQAGPSLGPIIGGLLAQYLGWHSIFWFLLICAGVIFISVVFLFPETCRQIVEDGSVPPPRWYRCWVNSKIEARQIKAGHTIPYERRDELAMHRRIRFPNPLETLYIVFTKEAGFILIFIGVVQAAFFSTVAIIPAQFGSVYGFNEIQIALCYLPLGAGTASAAFVRGRMIDARYKFHAKRLGVPLKQNRRMKLDNFPIERARLEVAVPTLILGSLAVIGFGWLVQNKVSLAVPLIFLFVLGFCVSATANTISVLLVDLYPGKVGTATAANNICRCWIGAGATAGVQPLVNKIGMGWTTTFFGLLIIGCSPTLWYVMVNGPKWRRATREKKQREEAAKAARVDAGGEKGQQQPHKP